MSDSKENGNEAKSDELTFEIGERVNEFKLVKKIDEGGFGQVYKVTKDGKTFYAMKLESNSQQGGSAIKLEISVLSQLPKDSVFPKFITGGKRTRYHYLVLELLGDNLKTLKARSVNPDSWSDGTWSRVGIQCLYAMKKMHEAGFVHRDLKPNNFAIGINTANEMRSRRVLLFDFGLARMFIKKVPGCVVKSKKTEKASKLKPTPSKASATAPSKASIASGPSKIKNSQNKISHHVPNKVGRQVEQKNKVKQVRNRLVGPKDVSQRTAEEKADDEVFEFRKPRPQTDFRGTGQYASINAHDRKELGRHDDISSLMYMIAEFFVELPWTNEEVIPVDDLKRQASLLRIFSDDKNPTRLTQEMRRQLNEIDAMLLKMNYYECPNYELVYQFLKDSMTKSRVKWDDLYDWEVKGTSEKNVPSKETSKPKGDKKEYTWKNPKNFFKKSRWEKLPMPSISPPASTKVIHALDPRSVIGYRKSDYENRAKQLSKEDSAADNEEVVPVVKPSTPIQKSMRTVVEEPPKKD